MDETLYSIDGLLWSLDKFNRTAIPICPKDRMELSYEVNNISWDDERKDINILFCDDCKEKYKLKRSLYDEIEYVVSKVYAMDRKDYDVVDLDGIKTPVTKKIKLNPENGYFCIAQVRDSKRGPQLVIYAGKKGFKEKSQILVMPEERRLSFDQNDINPADIFAKITAEFYDGTKHTIEGQKNE